MLLSNCQNIFTVFYSCAMFQQTSDNYIFNVFFQIDKQVHTNNCTSIYMFFGELNWLSPHLLEMFKGSMEGFAENKQKACHSGHLQNYVYNLEFFLMYLF